MSWAALHEAIRNRNRAKILEFKQLIPEMDEYEETVFHSAAYSGDEKVCDTLFELGARGVHTPNRWKTYPCQVACAKNNALVLQWILRHDPNAVEAKVEVTHTNRRRERRGRERRACSFNRRGGGTKQRARAWLPTYELSSA